MRNLSKHNYAVARRANPADEQEVVWYWVKGLVKPTSLSNLALRTPSGFNIIQKEYEFYTQDDKPRILEVTTPNESIDLRIDYAFWDGVPWGASQESMWINYGRTSHNVFTGEYSTDDVVAANLRTPPDFQNEYVAFIDAVASIKRVTNLSVCPLADKLNKLMETI